MNDKEIQVIDFAYLRMCAEHNYIYETGEAKLLLNYITNLQQENARLKDKMKDLQQRIEKTIEYINKYNKVNAERAKTEIDRLAMLINANDLLEILKGGNNEDNN